MRGSVQQRWDPISPERRDAVSLERKNQPAKERTDPRRGDIHLYSLLRREGIQPAKERGNSISLGEERSSQHRGGGIL
jgi:hypothetical protein